MTAHQTTCERTSVTIDLTTAHWDVVQDVHDSGEKLGLPGDTLDLTAVGAQLSEWEALDRLEHLQIAFTDSPYAGRELRSFNAAPWWYRVTFPLDPNTSGRSRVEFSNVDYFCRVWLNGKLLGEHEGYSEPFSFDITDALRDGNQVLMVKVWSPWDTDVLNDFNAVRTTQVVRDMAKGTYEHDDTLVPRDVNPVGIFGTVRVHPGDSPYVVGPPRVRTTLGEGVGPISLPAPA